MNENTLTDESNSYQMNRLIIVGNGFDLAHGMETSFKNFIIWYLSESYAKADKDEKYEDKLISVNRITKFTARGNYSNILEYVKYGFDRNAQAFLTNTTIFDNYGNGPSPFFNLTLKTTFMTHLLKTCIPRGWVDIEDEYYKRLKELLTGKTINEKEISSLNITMNDLMVHFNKYLKSLPKPERIQGYDDIFEQEIKLRNILSVQLEKDILPAQTLVLNFNYTDTVYTYASRSKKLRKNQDQFLVNNIHGSLIDPKNPLIFGFGDELDEDYKDIENRQTEGSLKYIKSFWYFNTDNYHNLIRFIELNDYQVYILGHSCGLSDRTLLSMIFEHEQCKSIKIFHYQESAEKNNFTGLTQNISRHFTNKIMMRKKIVPFDEHWPMPQKE